MKKWLLVSSVLAGLVVGNTGAQAVDAEIMCTAGATGIPVPCPVDAAGYPIVDVQPPLIWGGITDLLSHVVTTGGTQTTVANSSTLHGCIIQNPLSAAQQNIGTSESLFVTMWTQTAVLTGGSSSIELQPGDRFNSTSGVQQKITVNAATSGHKFNGYCW